MKARNIKMVQQQEILYYQFFQKFSSIKLREKGNCLEKWQKYIKSKSLSCLKIYISVVTYIKEGREENSHI